MTNTFTGLSNSQLEPIKRKIYSLLDMIKDMGGDEIQNKVEIYEAILNGFEQEMKNKIGGSQSLRAYSLIENGDFRFNFIRHSNNFAYEGIDSPIFSTSYQPMTIPFSIDVESAGVHPVIRFNNVLNKMNRGDFNKANNEIIIPLAKELLQLKDLHRKYDDIKPDDSYSESTDFYSNMQAKYDTILPVRRALSVFMDKYPLHEYHKELCKINDSFTQGLNITEDISSIKNMIRFFKFVDKYGLLIRTNEVISMYNVYAYNKNLLNNISYMIKLKKDRASIDSNIIQNAVNATSLVLLEKSTHVDSATGKSKIDSMRLSFKDIDFEQFQNMIQTIIAYIPEKLDRIQTLDDDFNFMKMKQYSTNITEDYIRGVINLRDTISKIDTITQSINSFSINSFVIQSLHNIKIIVSSLSTPLKIIADIKMIIHRGIKKNYSNFNMSAGTLLDNLSMINKLNEYPEIQQGIQDISKLFENFSSSFNSSSIKILEEVKSSISDLKNFTSQIDELSEPKVHDEAYEKVHDLNSSVAEVHLNIIEEFYEFLFKVNGFQGASEIVDALFNDIKDAYNSGAKHMMMLNNINPVNNVVDNDILLSLFDKIRSMNTSDERVTTIMNSFDMSQDVIDSTIEQYYRVYKLKYREFLGYIKNRYNIDLELLPTHDKYNSIKSSQIMKSLQQVKALIDAATDSFGRAKYDAIYDIAQAMNYLVGVKPINFDDINVTMFKLYDEAITSITTKLLKETTVSIKNKCYLLREYHSNMKEVNIALMNNSTYTFAADEQKSYDLNIMYYAIPEHTFSLKDALNAEDYEEANAKIAYAMKVYNEQNINVNILQSLLDQMEHKTGNIINMLNIIAQSNFISKEGSIVKLNFNEEDKTALINYINDVEDIYEPFTETYNMLVNIHQDMTSISKDIKQDNEIIKQLFNDDLLNNNTENIHSIMSPLFFKKLKQANNNFGDINDVYISAQYKSDIEKFYNSLSVFSQQLGKHIGEYTKSIRPLITGNSTQIMSNNKVTTQLEKDAVELLANKDLSITSVATRKYNIIDKNIIYPDENKFNLCLPNTSKVLYMVSDIDDIYNTSNNPNSINISNNSIAIDLDNRCLAYDIDDKINVCYPVYKIVARSSGAFRVENIGWGVINSVGSSGVKVLNVDAKMDFEYSSYLGGFDLRGSKSVTLKRNIDNVSVVDNNKKKMIRSLVSKELILNGNNYGYIISRYPVLYNESSLSNIRAGMDTTNLDIPSIQSSLDNADVELNTNPIYPMLHQEQLLYYTDATMVNYHSYEGTHTLNDIFNADDMTVSHLKYKYAHGNNTELMDEQIITVDIHGESKHIVQNNTIHLVNMEWRVIDHNFGTGVTGIELVKLFLSKVYGDEYSTYTSEMQDILDKVELMLNDSVTYYPIYSRDKSTLLSASIYYHFNVDIYIGQSNEIKKFVSRLNSCITYDVRAVIYDDIEGALNCKKGQNIGKCIFPFMFDNQIKYLDNYTIDNYAGKSLPTYCNMVWSAETNKGYLVSPSMLHRTDPLRYCHDKTKFISDYDYDTEIVSAMYNGLSAEENGLYPIRASYTHACNYFRVNEIIEINDHPHIKVIDRDCNVVGGLSENCLDIILPRALDVDMSFPIDRMLPISALL